MYVPLHCCDACSPSNTNLERSEFARNLHSRRYTMSGTAVGSGKVVCVTGASGFIASWLVKLLLQRGYTIHATVTDPSNPKKTLHLRALDGATERLHFFKANLVEDGSFDAAIQGCDGVFHTASPCFFETKSPQVELIEPAVKGTLNVLSSCKKFSIKRVIITSSISAVLFNMRPKTLDTIIDETWFSSSEVCRKEERWYSLSKTLAEEAAWKFAKENAIDMITINPTMVIGPLLQPTLNTSCATFLMLANGSATYPNATFGWVNIQDVAKAHVLAFEVPSASGRYLLNESTIHCSDLVKKIKELYPDLDCPDRCDDEGPLVPILQVSTHKVKSLGIDYIPMETSIKETIESLKEKGLLFTPLVGKGYMKI